MILETILVWLIGLYLAESSQVLLLCMEIMIDDFRWEGNELR